MRPVKIDYYQHRRRFQDQLRPNSVAIFIAPPASIRSHDVEFPYRTSSDIYYLTGFEEPHCALVLTADQAIIYLRERDVQSEQWTGYRLGVRRARQQLQFDESRNINVFFKELAGLLQDKEVLYYKAGVYTAADQRVFATLHQVRQSSRNGDFAPEVIINPDTILHEMRLLKNTAEIEAMQNSASITGLAHENILQNSKVGMYAWEVEAWIKYTFRQHNALEAYPSIVAPGKEACILHYIENKVKLKAGDLVLVDAGAEFQYYAADVTRTWPVSNRFTPAQRDLYQIVLQAQKEAIRSCVKGSSLQIVHQAALQVLIDGLKSLKLLQGSMESILADESYKKYYMHKTSHFLGMDVHDVGNYFDKQKKPRPLRNGMVITVEPGLYIPPSDRLAPREMRGCGIRIEDDILIQNARPRNLTDFIPKEIAEIEALRSAG
ncbi:MAG: aminopeptidase P N-terminal domain-containing protein [Leptospiraceae bacterium]|nr:aminopeptidase P N-terminal domain-containing protein [Leptospiraceae bacterium]